MQCPKLLVRCLLFCLLGQLLWASPLLAEITKWDFPSIESGSLYVADVPDHMEQVWLYLLDENYFVLKKTRSVSGKSKELGQFTGRWRQVDSGANLQLTNTFGLSLVLNIGSSGKLYGSMQVGDAISTNTLSMSKIPYSKPQFNISGVLETRGSHFELTDSAAGRTFTKVECDLDISSVKNPVFIEAAVSLAKQGIKIEHIYSSTEKIPSSLHMQKENWGDFVYEDTWQNDPVKGMQAASCRFHRTGIAGGVLEISGPGLHLELPYRVDEQILSFPTGGARSGNLAPDAQPWLEILSGAVRWQHEGNFLFLRSSTGKTLQLHKAGR